MVEEDEETSKTRCKVVVYPAGLAVATRLWRRPHTKNDSEASANYQRCAIDARVCRVAEGKNQTSKKNKTHQVLPGT